MVLRLATRRLSLRRFFHLLAVALLCVGLTGNARAEPAHDAQEFVNGLVLQAVAILRDKQLGDADRERKIRALLDADFDIPRIARFVLGRYWNTTDPQQQHAFEQLFEQWTVRSYASRFKEYSGETVKLIGAHAESDTGISVASQILHPDGAPPLKLDWRLRHDDSGFKIIDVTVAGVSLALTQREEFAAVISRNGGTLDGLNKALQEKLAAGRSPTGS